MRNRVKSMIKQSQVAVGSIVSAIGSPNLMWMLASAGFDFVYIDAEHSSFSIETIGRLILAARGAGIVPIVRPPTLDPPFMSRCLDSGALGVLVPHVETVAEARLVTDSCKYAPQGHRGISSRQVQTNYRALKDTESINEEVLVEIMVESHAAVERVDDLVSVPGVDVVVVGLSDLAQDMGLGTDRNHRLVAEAVDRVIQICTSRNVAVGLHTYEHQQACRWIEKGIRMLSFSSDVAMIVDTNMARLRALRESAAPDCVSP